MEDFSIKQLEQNDRKIYLLYFKTRGERRATKGGKRGRPSYKDVKGMKEESGGKKVDQF